MEPYFDDDEIEDPPRAGFRWRRALILTLLALILLWVLIKLPDFSARAELGTAYAAQMGCACHYVEGRDVESCTGDLEEAAWMVSIEADEDARAVTGSVPLFGSRTAQYRPGWGCLLQPEE